VATQQQLFELVSTVANNHVPSAMNPPVGSLVTWAAFNVGMARTGVGIVQSLATADGWTDLQRVLGLDSYDVTEAGALSMTAATVTTSIDLAAAAAFRLAGAVPKDDSHEFAMSSFSSTNKYLKDQVATHPLPLALRRWKEGVLLSIEWQLLKQCRNQLIHKNLPPRHIFASFGPNPRMSSTEVTINGTKYPIDGLVSRFSAFGEKNLNEFCAAVIADFP
jgi:hypothetical protein